MPISTLELALDYLTNNPGRYLFPIRPGFKDPPLIKDNLDTASNDFATIRSWHAKWPGCNWGLALKKSKLLVVDVDMKPGKNGKATFDELDLMYGWPATEAALSPSGGMHHYYDGEHIFGLGKYGFGPDVDSPNYVLIPGCTLENGTSYKSIPSPATQPCPDWFYEVLAAARNRTAVEQTSLVELDTPDTIDRAIQFLKFDARPSIVGRAGESMTMQVAGVLKDMGISEHLCLELMAEHYNVPGTCDPLWLIGEGADADRLDIKVRNAYSYLKGKAPGSDTAAADFADEDVPVIEHTPEELKAMKRDKKRAEKLDKRETSEQMPRTNLTALCDDWVYIAALKQFLNRRDNDQVWDIQAFDNAFAYLKPAKANSLSKAMLSKATATIRRIATLGYKPGRAEFLDNGKLYNLYRPSDVIPKEGDTKFWNDHLAYLFPDAEVRGHVLNWMAWLLQNIAKKPKHALLVQGQIQGTGKSFMAEMLMMILGKHNVAPVAQEELRGSFNRWAMASKLLLIEELRSLDKREVANKLHPMVTQERITINDKNIKTFPIDNCFGMFVMTNDDAAIPLDQSDRRYLVARTDAIPRDPAYYGKLYAHLDNAESVAAVAYELMHRDLGEYDGQQRAPHTKAKDDMIEAGLGDLERFMVEHRGEPPLSGRVTSIQDVMDMLPKRLERTSRIEHTITSILKRRFQAQPLGQHRVNDGRRLSLWALNGTALTKVKDWEGSVAGIYEKDRERAHAGASGSAAADFNEA